MKKIKSRQRPTGGGPGDLKLSGDKLAQQTELQLLLENIQETGTDGGRAIAELEEHIRVTGVSADEFNIAVYGGHKFEVLAALSENPLKGKEVFVSDGAGMPPAETVKTLKNKVEFFKAVK